MYNMLRFVIMKNIFSGLQKERNIWRHVSSLCCKFLKNPFKVWFYTYFFFHAFIYEYSLRAGADNPLGTKFDVNRKALPICPFVASLKKSLWSLILYIFSHAFIHAYQSLACETSINTDFSKLFSLKRIYVKYKNAILSLIGCCFRTWKD